MKKLIIALGMALACSFGAAAQLINFRVEAAPSFSFSSAAEAGLDIMNSGTKVGYHIGAYVDVPVFKGLYVGSGATFAMKGNKFNVKNKSWLEKIKDQVTFSDTNEITMHYLQIPVNVGYKLNIAPTIKVGIQTGPYFAAALGASYKTGIAGKMESYNIFKDGVKGLTTKRFDLGWGAAAMAYLGNYYGTIGADFGFLNVSKFEGVENMANEVKNIDFKNQTHIYVGIGYNF